MKQYAARLDILSKILTISVVALVGFDMYHVGRRGMAEPWVWIVLIALGCTFLFMPTNYLIDSITIEINRPIGAIRIPLREVTNVERIVTGELGGGLRMFGSGGFMGYLGYFWYPAKGSIRMHCTDRSKMVLITRGKKKYMISPDEPEDFISEVNEAILDKTSR